MKNILLAVSFIIVSLAFVFMPIGKTEAYSSTSSSPGGKTNSPGDANSCTQCHNATINSGQGTATISSVGLSNGYVAGQTYTIAVGITGTSSSKIGFEVTAEETTNNTKAGSIIISDAARTQTCNNGNAVTHKTAGTTAVSGSNSWTFDWTAPVAGTGNVTFYGAFNASNSNGSPGGDEIYTTTFTVSENITSINEVSKENNILIYPNPATNYISVINSNEIYYIELYNISGKLVFNSTNTQKINISHLKSGVYMLKANTSNSTLVKKFIKE